MLSKNVLLHHDNACPHTAAVTVDSATNGLRTSSTSSLQSGFDTKRLSHLPPKKALHSRRFTSNEEVKEVVHTWLREQPKSFFSAGIPEQVE